MLHFPFDLYYLGAPVFSVEPEDAVIDEGGVIRLHCVASGEPKPTIKYVAFYYC